ncbi:GDSL-type esterase/lipase family protein [Neobacillus niacini]|uniref:GDSL-type esterase/lipase family protein n=1 Tax=Neobacillus niacini TaxID=86668 RepID=UPI002FFE5D41
MTIQLKRNDTKDIIGYTMTYANGTPVNLTGATVRYVMGKGNTLITNASATVVDAAIGKVEYALTDADTLVAGVFHAEFEVTFADGKVKTFPNNGYISVNIQSNINKDKSTYVEDTIALRVSDIEVFKNDVNAKVAKAETDAAKVNDFSDRINNIVSQAGNSNTEIVDARLRNDGTVASTLGGHVRELASSLAQKAAQSYVDTKIASVATGSPKGVYATVAALQTAFPTGNTNVYVVSADGKWYYWNGSAWTAGGTYQATGIERKSVTDVFAEESGLKINTITTQANVGATNLYTERIYDISNAPENFLLNLKTIFKSASAVISGIWAQAWLNDSPTPSDLTNATSNNLATVTYTANSDLLYDKSVSITKGGKRYLHLFIRLNLSTAGSAATFTLSETLLLADGKKLVPINDFSGFTNNYQSFSNVITYKSDDVITKEKLPGILSTEGYLKTADGETLIENALSKITDNITHNITADAAGTNTVIHTERVYDISNLPQSTTFEVGTVFSAAVDVFSGFLVKIFINDIPTAGDLTNAARTDLAEDSSYVTGTELSYKKTVTIDRGTNRYMHIYFCPRLKTAGGSGTFKLIEPYVSVNGEILAFRSDFTGYLVDSFSFTKTVLTSPIVTEERVNEIVTGKLSGGTDWEVIVWNAEGDSLTEINYQSTKFYHQFVKEWLGIPTVNNYGVSGSTAAGVYNRRANLAANADIITVWIGTNDAKNSTPIGTISDSTTSTFYGALNLMAEYLLNTFPNKRVGLITLHVPAGTYYADPNTAGHSTEDYANAMIAVGKKYSIPVLDLYHSGGFTLKNATQNSLLATDGLHLNALGHERVARKVRAFLETL